MAILNGERSFLYKALSRPSSLSKHLEPLLLPLPVAKESFYLKFSARYFFESPTVKLHGKLKNGSTCSVIRHRLSARGCEHGDWLDLPHAFGRGFCRNHHTTNVAITYTSFRGVSARRAHQRRGQERLVARENEGIGGSLLFHRITRHTPDGGAGKERVRKIMNPLGSLSQLKRLSCPELVDLMEFYGTAFPSSGHPRLWGHLSRCCVFLLPHFSPHELAHIVYIFARTNYRSEELLRPIADRLIHHRDHLSASDIAKALYGYATLGIHDERLFIRLSALVPQVFLENSCATSSVESVSKSTRPEASSLSTRKKVTSRNKVDNVASRISNRPLLHRNLCLLATSYAILNLNHTSFFTFASEQFRLDIGSFVKAVKERQSIVLRRVASEIRSVAAKRVTSSNSQENEIHADNTTSSVLFRLPDFDSAREKPEATVAASSFCNNGLPAPPKPKRLVDFLTACAVLQRRDEALHVLVNQMVHCTIPVTLIDNSNGEGSGEEMSSHGLRMKSMRRWVKQLKYLEFSSFWGHGGYAYSHSAASTARIKTNDCVVPNGLGGLSSIDSHDSSISMKSSSVDTIMEGRDTAPAFPSKLTGTEAIASLPLVAMTTAAANSIISFKRRHRRVKAAASSIVIRCGSNGGEEIDQGENNRNERDNKCDNRCQKRRLDSREAVSLILRASRNQALSTKPSREARRLRIALLSESGVNESVVASNGVYNDGYFSSLNFHATWNFVKPSASPSIAMMRNSPLALLYPHMLSISPSSSSLQAVSMVSGPTSATTSSRTPLRPNFGMCLPVRPSPHSQVAETIPLTYSVAERLHAPRLDWTFSHLCSIISAFSFLGCPSRHLIALWRDALRQNLHLLTLKEVAMVISICQKNGVFNRLLLRRLLQHAARMLYRQPFSDLYVSFSCPINDHLSQSFSPRMSNLNEHVWSPLTLGAPRFAPSSMRPFYHTPSRGSVGQDLNGGSAGSHYLMSDRFLTAEHLSDLLPHLRFICELSYAAAYNPSRASFFDSIIRKRFLDLLYLFGKTPDRRRAPLIPSAQSPFSSRQSPPSCGASRSVPLAPPDTLLPVSLRTDSLTFHNKETFILTELRNHFPLLLHIAANALPPPLDTCAFTFRSAVEESYFLISWFSRFFESESTSVAGMSVATLGSTLISSNLPTQTLIKLLEDLMELERKLAIRMVFSIPESLRPGTRNPPNFYSSWTPEKLWDALFSRLQLSVDKVTGIASSRGSPSHHQGVNQCQPLKKLTAVDNDALRGTRRDNLGRESNVVRWKQGFGSISSCDTLARASRLFVAQSWKSLCHENQLHGGQYCHRHFLVFRSNAVSVRMLLLHMLCSDNNGEMKSLGSRGSAFEEDLKITSLEDTLTLLRMELVHYEDDFGKFVGRDIHALSGLERCNSVTSLSSASGNDDNLNRISTIPKAWFPNDRILQACLSHITQFISLASVPQVLNAFQCCTSALLNGSWNISVPHDLRTQFFPARSTSSLPSSHHSIDSESSKRDNLAVFELLAAFVDIFVRRLRDVSHCLTADAIFCVIIDVTEVIGTLERVIKSCISAVKGAPEGLTDAVISVVKRDQSEVNDSCTHFGDQYIVSKRNRKGVASERMRAVLMNSTNLLKTLRSYKWWFLSRMEIRSSKIKTRCNDSVGEGFQRHESARNGRANATNYSLMLINSQSPLVALRTLVSLAISPIFRRNSSTPSLWARSTRKNYCRGWTVELSQCSSSQRLLRALCWEVTQRPTSLPPFSVDELLDGHAIGLSPLRSESFRALPSQSSASPALSASIPNFSLPPVSAMLQVHFLEACSLVLQLLGSLGACSADHCQGRNRRKKTSLTDLSKYRPTRISKQSWNSKDLYSSDRRKSTATVRGRGTEIPPCFANLPPNSHHFLRFLVMMSSRRAALNERVSRSVVLSSRPSRKAL